MGVERPPGFWDKPWQLVLIVALTLLVSMPLVIGLLAATGHHCETVAACLTGDPKLDQNRPCFQANQPMPAKPC